MAGHFYQFIHGQGASRQELRILTFLKNSSFPLSPSLSKKKKKSSAKLQRFSLKIKIGDQTDPLTSSHGLSPRWGEGVVRKGKGVPTELLDAQFTHVETKKGGPGALVEGP